MALVVAKRVADPVHGTIGLTEVEAAVIGTRAFLRLQGVKHLGLAHMVYPGADFSRFSHSLGACHVAGRILDVVRGPLALTDQEVQRHRLAALLHDVGHYPFSHATERAAQNYYTGRVALEGAEYEVEADPALNHEQVGREVIENDPETVAVLQGAAFEPRQITSVIMHEDTGGLSNLVSSDLDADRIDYLMRMALHTGLPYGRVDLDYILSQLVVDDEGAICVTSKALRTVEHLLLQRLFAFQQIAYHKTVAALEQVLAEAIGLLLEEGLLDYSGKGIKAAIRSGAWADYTDARVNQVLHSLYDRLVAAGSTAINARTKVSAVLHREPPKMLLDSQLFADREALKDFRRALKTAKVCRAQLAVTFGIAEDLIYLWNTSTSLTKVGSRAPISEEFPAEEKQQSIHVVSGGGAKSTLAVEMKSSLLSVLGQYALFALRLYVLFPEDWQAEQRERVLGEMKKFARDNHPSLFAEE